jgi:hypothetical protein
MHRTECVRFGCQKQTFCDAGVMSALTPKADICSALAHVRLVPKADITLFDHLVGNQKEFAGNREP